MTRTVERRQKVMVNSRLSEIDTLVVHSLEMKTPTMRAQDMLLLPYSKVPVIKVGCHRKPCIVLMS